MFQPSNELGVVFLFGQLCAGVDHVHMIELSAAFPDATVLWNGMELAVEFEYVASNFINHQHDVRNCDLVICWENDLSGTGFPLPVIELCQQNPLSVDISLAEEATKDLYYWKAVATTARKKITKLEAIVAAYESDGTPDVEIVDVEKSECESYNPEDDARALASVISTLPSLRSVGRFLYGYDLSASVSGQMIRDRVIPALKHRHATTQCPYAERLISRSRRD